ncbi:MAG: pyroglutamyl-peptidase I [Polaromonas sp.]|nr:pyroglutamyl-peptidase I [Polaromonas sp.]
MIRTASSSSAKLSADALPRVLLTGFDAFGGARINPSWLAVKALDAEVLAGHQLVAAQLPTEFDASLKELARLLTLNRPRLVLCVGQAGGRSALSIERIAINIIDASIADNAGKQPLDLPVFASGPAAYFSTLPIKAMLQALNQAGVAAEVSQTAGTFVCNHVFYALLHALATKRGFKRARGGFVHVPYLAEQGMPSMPLDEMVRGLRLAVECALTARDVPALTTLSSGKIS